MIETQPKVYCVAKTEIDDSKLEQFISDIGQNWSSNTENSADELIEVAGRLCYRSWAPYDGTSGTNQNVTRIRTDNSEYIRNIIKSNHGSVLEHANISMIFQDVSRVFTHELVRHRAGMAYSQESLRYVRLDQLKFWLPQEIKENEELTNLYIETIEYLEGVQKRLNQIVNLEGKDFSEKKKWTSRFRRLAPIGLATSILVTGNLRAWRHIINMRGGDGAEEEIKLVMDQVVPILKDFAPAVFSDLSKINNEWIFELNPKP